MPASVGRDAGRNRVKLAKVDGDVVLGLMVHDGKIGINAASQFRGELVLDVLLLWSLLFQPPTPLSRLHADVPLHVVVSLVYPVNSVPRCGAS